MPAGLPNPMKSKGKKRLSGQNRRKLKEARKDKNIKLQTTLKNEKFEYFVLCERGVLMYDTV